MTAQRPYLHVLVCFAVTLLHVSACSDRVAATEFCLDGELDLGARYQGLRPESGEIYPTRFCYVSEDESERVLFQSRGQSNPDMQDEWTVAFLPPDTVRIVNRDTPPDVEFSGKLIIDEALRYRRADPKRLLDEIDANPDWVVSRSDDGWQNVDYPGSDFETQILIIGGMLVEARTLADIPLRGRVPVAWRWDWSDADRPRLTILFEDDVLFSALASWRSLTARETNELWHLSDQQEPIAVPGDRWPATIDMQLKQLADGVHLVTGVRTGFAHIVIETAQGLVVGDAPTGWVELQQMPPADLVPGLGVSGLSQNLIDFLLEKFPGTPIRAVAITHVHDDHAGGARAFAAAGADVYAPEGISAFLTEAMNRASMPDDALTAIQGQLRVIPVADRHTLDDDTNAVELMVLPAGPHVDTALGVWARNAGIFYQSDLHVPRSDDDAPRQARAATECWFATWAVANLPDDTIVVNSHTPPRTPVSRLVKYLDSDSCRRL